jgi:hypothetical protein
VGLTFHLDEATSRTSFIKRKIFTKQLSICISLAMVLYPLCWIGKKNFKYKTEDAMNKIRVSSCPKGSNTINFKGDLSHQLSEWNNQVEHIPSKFIREPAAKVNL